MCVGIAHRDLKPENILVNYRHTKTPVVKVCDFGLSLEQKGTWGLLSGFTEIALYAVTRWSQILVSMFNMDMPD
jgi:serine/threonine protein kinase